MKKAKWIILAITIAFAFVALWMINRAANQIRHSEEEKVRLWANAISQKNQLVNYTEDFFDQIYVDEHRKMKLYADLLVSFANPNLSTDVDFGLRYVNYIMDSSQTATIITDKDSIITSCRNIYGDSIDVTLIGKKLGGVLLEEFSQNAPFHYKIWGMPMTLYYKESKIYTELRQVLNSLTESFLAEITNNSVFVPVIIVDSARSKVLGFGNIQKAEFDTPQKLQRKLEKMRSENEPIVIKTFDNRIAYVFYEQTPLLRLLGWVPLLYLFIAAVLILVSYNLFRTAHTMEQNRIWVGLAKETAHQLGTPISSLLAWTEYLEGKTFDETYAKEIRKDLTRLETITHRFSKIGSVPELTESNVGEAISNAVNYLQNRSSKKVNFTINIPAEPMIAPLNTYLFEWVVENICKNAIDAMEGSGTFSVIASQDAHSIYIDLCDTGKGMSSHTQKHLFDSGFTTKQRGWGLGLSLAKRIIEEYHKGKIFLKYSIPGQGSVFRIILNKR